MSEALNYDSFQQVLSTLGVSTDLHDNRFRLNAFGWLLVSRALDSMPVLVRRSTTWSTIGPHWPPRSACPAEINEALHYSTSRLRWRSAHPTLFQSMQPSANAAVAYRSPLFSSGVGAGSDASQAHQRKFRADRHSIVGDVSNAVVPQKIAAASKSAPRNPPR